MSDETKTSREIARAVLSLPLDLSELAKNTSRESVVSALDGFHKAMIPTHRLTKGERAENQKTLAQRMRSIGLRIRPDFSEDQAQMWIASMIEALEGLPMPIALLASRDAVHHPIRYPAEVLTVILEKAEPHLANYRRAIANLERLLREIDQPANQAETVERDKILISDDELQDMPRHFRSLGIAAGWLIEDGGRIRWSTEDEQRKHAERKRAETPIARTKDRGGR